MLGQKCTVCKNQADKKCTCGVLYCSKKCQNKDWGTHKKICKVLRSEEGKIAKSIHYGRNSLIESVRSMQLSEDDKVNMVRNFGDYVDYDIGTPAASPAKTAKK